MQHTRDFTGDELPLIVGASASIRTIARHSCTTQPPATSHPRAANRAKPGRKGTAQLTRQPLDATSDRTDAEVSVEEEVRARTGR